MTDTMTQLFPAALKAPEFSRSILTLVGGVWVVTRLQKLLSFVWLHFFRSGTLGRYTRPSSGKPPWALVTGASDGVGRGFVEELLERGFNIVLHGRNERKLQGVIDELRLQWPQRELKLLVLDASARLSDANEVSEKLQQLEHLELKVLINNVGGNGGEESFLQLIQEQSAESVDTW